MFVCTYIRTSFYVLCYSVEVSCSAVMVGESSPLLPVSHKSVSEKSCRKKSSFCIQSRPARWILLWSFAVLLTYRLLCCFEILGQVSYSSTTPILVNAGFIVISIFSPVAGLLSDVKWSRYRAVLYSSCAIIMALTVTLFIVIIVLLQAKYDILNIDKKKRGTIFIGFFSGIVLFYVVYIIFLINAFQFGIDQLHDASTQDCVSYIRTLVCVDLPHQLSHLFNVS